MRRAGTLVLVVVTATILGCVLAVVVLTLLRPAGIHPLAEAALAGVLIAVGYVLLALLIRAVVSIRRWRRSSKP